MAGGVGYFVADTGGKHKNIARFVGVFAVLIVHKPSAFHGYHYFFNARVVVSIVDAACRHEPVCHHFKPSTLQVLGRGIHLSLPTAPVRIFLYYIFCGSLHNLHVLDRKSVV